MISKLVTNNVFKIFMCGPYLGYGHSTTEGVKRDVLYILTKMTY